MLGLGSGGITVRIKAASDNRAVVKYLESSDKALRKEFRRALRVAAKPVVRELRASARGTLPKRGGLNRVAAKGIGSLARADSLVIRSRTTTQTDALNKGTVRHPVWRHRDRWVVQSVKPGWWDHVIDHAEPGLRQALVVASRRALELR